MSYACLVTRTTCCLLLLLSVGCQLGPRQIHKGRLDYNEAIQTTFQEEMLLNLVRLKYREVPEFLTVGGIAAQYTFDGSAAAGLTIPEGAPNILGLDAAVARSERPTISYTPARGEDFQRGLLAPIDTESLQLLARTGWSWERILRTTVQYMNDVDNATSAGGPTPDRKPRFEEFRYLAQLMRQLQIQRGIELAPVELRNSEKIVPIPEERLDGDFVVNALKEGFNFDRKDGRLILTKDKEFLALVVHPEAKHSREVQEMAGLLNLAVNYDDPNPAAFKIISAKEGRILPIYDNREKRDEIVVSTRSLLEVMFYLSQGIQIPEEHVMTGLVTTTLQEDGTVFDWTELTGDLLQVYVSKHCPKHHAAVAVRYKGYWFYIDDRDLNSQSTFTLLVELFGIEVRAGGGGGFLYTLSVGG